MDNNLIKTETKIVAFVDILGFSKMITDYDNNIDKSILQNLIGAMRNATDYIKQSKSFADNSTSSPFFHYKDCLETKLFSDCLCASVPLKFKNKNFMYNVFDQFYFFYQYLAGYQIILMKKGIFTRGAITIGSYFSDENIIFSGGLVDAYNLETNVANYPRIIVSNKLIETFNIIKLKIKSNWDFSKILCTDNTGAIFINPFNYNISTLNMMDDLMAKLIKDTGVDGLTDETFYEKDIRLKKEEQENVKNICNNKVNCESEKVKEKYQWYIDFLNSELGIENIRSFKEYDI